jgi:hypothetical protein
MVRKHPAMLMVPVVVVLGGLIVAAILSNTVASRAGTGLTTSIWWLWLALLGWFVWRVAQWSVDYFVITNQRMLLTTGLITRKVAMMPLSKVTDMSFERSLTGRLVGYGQFVLESAGQDQAFRTVTFLPYPEQLYLEVCEMIFPAKAPPAEPSEEDQIQARLEGDMKELSVIDALLAAGEIDTMKLAKLHEDKNELQGRIKERHERLEQLKEEKEGSRRR